MRSGRGNNHLEKAVTASQLPDWQLPRGVPRGAWEYAHAEHIATDYDAYFAPFGLFQFDEHLLAERFTRPGLAVDLGCGTGRAVLPLARRGFRTLAVDLSPPMLKIVGEKAAAEQLRVWRLCANLVELDCLRAQVADYCVCLFSTLGMIRGRTNRQRVLDHAFRILKPGGQFIVHVHNFWSTLWYAEGRRYLLGHLWSAAVNRDVERGDRFYEYLGIPKMYLHTFGERELRTALRRAGFVQVELIRLDAARQRPLRAAWWLGALRASGWIAVCRRPGETERS